MSLRATQLYLTALDRGAGTCRVTQVYVAALAKDPPANGKVRVSQTYATVLCRVPSWVRATQVYITVLGKDQVVAECGNSLGFTEAVPFQCFVPPNPTQEYVSMGAVTDLLAAPKSFSVPSKLSQYLQAKTSVVDPAVPAAYAVADAVHTIPQAESDDGTWTLTITLRNGVTFTTAALNHDDNAATIEAAIDTASPASVAAGDIVVTGGPIDSADVVLTFSGDTVAGQNHGLSVATSVDLTLVAAPVASPTVVKTTPGQTARNARAVLLNLGVISDATPPDQGLTTAPTKGANLLGVPPWVVRELAQEVAFEDLDNDIYQVLVTALLGYTDVAPLVSD